MNRLVKIGLIAIVVLAIILMASRKGEISFLKGESTRMGRSSAATDLRAEGRPTTSRPTLPERLPIVKMKAVKYEIDYAALARSREDPPFEFRGGAGIGRVLDRKGRVILDSGGEIGILGVAIGPDRQHVLVEGGSAVNFVMNPATGLKLKLPLTPPGSNVFGFGWQWIGNTKLLGVSGTKSISKKSDHDNSMGQTMIYVYDVSTQNLAEVNLPSNVSQTVFNVADVSGDGHVHLVLDEPVAGIDPDLGWFKIDSD